MLIDLDHFKEINDTAGHEAGDRVLLQVAEVHLPPGALLARHGGDEFALLLPGRGGEEAVAEVWRICDRLAGTGLSCGVAQLHAGESAAQLMRRADGALYAAKAAGRAQAVAARSCRSRARAGFRMSEEVRVGGGRPPAGRRRVARFAVVPVAMGWNDVGSWDALHATSDTDDDGNAHRSTGGEVIALETTNCLVRSDGVRIAMVGVSDLVVVASGNDVLILPRGRSQEVKKLIEAMKDSAPRN